MTITVTRFVQLIGYQKVYFHSECGDAAGVWHHDELIVPVEYNMEFSVSKPVQWGKELQPSDTTTHSLSMQNDTVVFVGILEYWVEELYTLRLCDGLIRIEIEGDKPHINGFIALSVPFHQVALCPYFI